jgi:hypothetical protein
MRRFFGAAALAVVALTVVLVVSAGATDSIPTGQRTFHNNTLEAVYNAANGQIGYLMEPNAPMHAHPRAWAPIYVVVYPTGSTAASTYLCMHFGPGNDNCPSHGNAIAGLAAATEPSVYGNGVVGHDHVFDFPGGDDFNIAWEPVVVLFKHAADANEHVVTDARIEELNDQGKVDLIPLPGATFLCAVVPQRIWDMGTPIPPG